MSGLLKYHILQLQDAFETIKKLPGALLAMALHVVLASNFLPTLITCDEGRLVVRLHMPLDVLFTEPFQANRADSLRIVYPEVLLGGLDHWFRSLQIVTSPFPFPSLSKPLLWGRMLAICTRGREKIVCSMEERLSSLEERLAVRSIVEGWASRSRKN